jgi:hypothetical protein
MDINKWLADHPTGSQYGASMGDDGVRGDPDRAYKFHLQHIDSVDGDYDRAGTYWGCGDPLYGFMCEDAEDGLVYGFVRARCKGSAKSAVLDTYPNARFYR